MDANHTLAESPPWPWPDSLDALVAAPDHHKLILENERVRVLDTIIRPGETVPVHTHRWPSVVYVLSWTDYVRRDGDGKLLLDSRTVKPRPPDPTVAWSPPLTPHTFQNVGDKDVHVISVELKEPAAANGLTGF